MQGACLQRHNDVSVFSAEQASEAPVDERQVRGVPDSQQDPANLVKEGAGYLGGCSLQI